MKEYIIAECPYEDCRYVWRVKSSHIPKACPRNKHRFDVAWCPSELKLYKKTFENYDALQQFLDEKNKRK